MAQDPPEVPVYYADKKALSVSEVNVLLEERIKKIRDEVNPDYQPNLLVQKTLEYSNAFATHKNKETIQKIRAALAQAGLTEMELALVANLSVNNAEEAKKLIPSLEGRFTDEALNTVLQEVNSYREFQ